MKKKWLNPLLIIAVAIIYLLIFQRSAGIFNAEESEIEPQVTQRAEVKIKKNDLERDFSGGRNYFLPFRQKKKVRKAVKKMPTQVMKKNIIPIDTLAVLGKGKNAKYLLKQGGKTWIE